MDDFLDDFSDALEDLSFFRPKSECDLEDDASGSSCAGGSGGGGTSVSMGVGDLSGIVDFSEVFVSDFFFLRNIKRDFDEEDDDSEGLPCCVGGCGGGVDEDPPSVMGFSESSPASPFLSSVEDLSDVRLSSEASGGGSGAIVCGVSGEDEGGRGAAMVGISGVFSI